MTARVTGRVTSRSSDASSDAAAKAAAFAAATTPLHEGLVRRLVLVLGNAADAEDIAQDTLLRGLLAWHQFDGENVHGWLYTIALRLAFNHLRRRRRWLAILRGAKRTEWVDHVDPDLWSSIQRLDARVRAALLLNVLDGYTQREIGTMLGVPEGTVSSWLTRARSQLRSDLTTQ